MKCSMYCLKDCKAGFKQPYIDVNNALAIRHVGNALQDKNQEFSLNPEDFELWKVGSFDTDTGILEPDLVHIINVQDILDGNVN